MILRSSFRSDLPFAAGPIAFLVSTGADRVAHSGGILLDHLIGTCAILERWGYAHDVCVSGLFHSVYGTSSFEPALLGLSERERVRAVIGEASERTAFLFSQMDHVTFWKSFTSSTPSIRLRETESVVRLDRLEILRLMAVLWANEVELARREPEAVAASGIQRLVEIVRHALSVRAYDEIRQIWP